MGGRVTQKGLTCFPALLIREELDDICPGKSTFQTFWQVGQGQNARTLKGEIQK